MNLTKIPDGERGRIQPMIDSWRWRERERDDSEESIIGYD
jgi:hypothetical protein